LEDLNLCKQKEVGVGGKRSSTLKNDNSSDMIQSIYSFLHFVAASFSYSKACCSARMKEEEQVAEHISSRDF
jgi:hypothetical protein